jgi:type II secretory pathway predicted ATPase ExeA/septal ring-binding cell division protein DamX
MYLTHFGLDEAPFRITPHTDFFYSGASRGATLEALLYAVQHDEGIIKVTGEVGSGKTMLCRMLIERLGDTADVVYLANPSLTRDEILFALADELKLPVVRERGQVLLNRLHEHLIGIFAKNRRVLVLVDEAHAMPPSTLEQIRLLSNLESSKHKLLQLVLFGQPELDDTLAANRMRQLRERITHSFTLGPFVGPDIAEYVDFRLRAAGYRGPRLFTPAALRIISRLSKGLTRRINILADKALLAAFVDNADAVRAIHARAAARDTEFGRLRWREGAWPWLAVFAIAAVVGIAVGVTTHLLRSTAGPLVAQEPATATQAAADSTSSGTTQAVVPIAEIPVAGEPPANAGATAPEGSSLPDMPPVAPATVAPAPNPSERLASTRPDDYAATSRLAEQLGLLAQGRLAATRDWLASAPAGTYSIQLLRADALQAEEIERFLIRAERSLGLSEIHVYLRRGRNDGVAYVGVLFGRFATREAASAAIDRLPAQLKTYSPYPRSIEAIVSGVGGVPSS